MSIQDVELLSKDEKNHEIADQLVLIIQDLIRIASPSGEEGKKEGIADFLFKFGENQPLWNVWRDEIHNIYFVPTECEDQELPLLMAHSDTAQNSDSAYLLKVNIVNKYSDDGLICDYPNIQLGYDDKCGIAIILWLIKYCKDIKFRAIVVVQEEKCNPSDGKTIDRRRGGCGVQYALEHRISFFKSRWGILLDRAEDKDNNQDYERKKSPKIVNKIRKEESDIIWKYAGEPICSEIFLSKLEKITDAINCSMRRAESSAKSDAMNIRLFHKTKHIDLVNLATGFYKEHEKDDYVNIFQLVRTLKVVEYCIIMNEQLSERP